MYNLIKPCWASSYFVNCANKKKTKGSLCCTAVTCNSWLYYPLLCDLFEMKSCHYVAVLSNSKQCSVSKVTTHLHCSHGHHIYHPVHSIQWLANQGGITYDDVRWAQLSFTIPAKWNDSNSYTWRYKVAAPIKEDADWQRNQCVSIAWPLGAWREVNDKHAPWPDDMIFPARSSQSLLIL